MKWYKELMYKFDRKFNEQFYKVGSTNGITITSQSITICYADGIYEGKSYLILKFVHSTGKEKNVINRIREVIKEKTNYNGIIYEFVISEKAYEKVKNFDILHTDSKENICEEYLQYFDHAYGTFIENFS